MSSLLYSIGRAAYLSRRRVLVTWLLVLVVAGALAGVLSQGLTNSFTIPGTPAQQALDTLSRTFPQVSGGAAQLVAVLPEGRATSDPAFRDAVEQSVRELQKLPVVASVADPYSSTVRNARSADGRAVIVTIQLDVTWDKATDADRATMQADAAPIRRAGAQVSFGGQVFSASAPGITPTEGLGVLVAFVVLLVTFGSLRAAGMPLLISLFGVAVSMCLVLASSRFVTVSSTVPLLALMIGLAVGIDYSLFVLSRHRDQLAEGLAPEESAAQAIATAGSAVVFAGLTVIIALIGLAVARIPFLTTMGVAAAGAVLVAVLVALTLLPALFGFAGARLAPKPARERRRFPRRRAGTGRSRAERPRFALRWVNAVTKVPVLTIVVVIVGLGILALPARDLRLALPDNATAPAGSTQRTAYDQVAEHFGPGYNAPLLVTADIINSTDPVGVVDGLASDLQHLPDVAAIQLATPNQDASTGIVALVPKGGPDDESTKALVTRIRGLHAHFAQVYGVGVQVTGQTALAIDVSDRLADALLPFAILVVGFSLLLLGAVFRSVAVPLKATVGYLLSVGASFGATVAVFQWGWLSGPLATESTGPVISFMPIVLMGVLFGLAMDYEVFLVSRMREEYVHHHDPQAAVTSGFVSGARVVTAAALIMFSVFVAFVPKGDPNVKPIAFALAVGVFVDAFVVRMVLVPAVLALLGRAAWWLPAGLDRRLPHLDIEGEGLRRELELADWPHPGSTDVIDAEDVGLSGPEGVVFTGVALAVPPGVVLAVHGGPGSGKTALLLTLAGRMRFDTGRLKVTGRMLPAQSRAVRAQVSLAEMPGLNDLEDSLSVEQHVAERISALDFRLWISRARVARVLDAVDTAVRAASGDAVRLDRKMLVADLTPVERKVLGIALAMVGTPAVVIVDDVDELRTAAERADLWRALAWLTEEFTDPDGRPVTVVASCQDAAEPAAAVPPERLQLFDLTGVHPESDRSTLEKVR